MAAPSPDSESPISFSTVVAVVAPLLFLVVLASLFTPDTIRADEPTAWRGSTTGPQGASTPSTQPRAAGPRLLVDADLEAVRGRLPRLDVASEPDALGLMIGRRHAVRVHSGEPLRYSVYRVDDVLVAARLTAPELGARFPELDIDDVRSRRMLHLMLADPLDSDDFE